MVNLSETVTSGGVKVDDGASAERAFRVDDMADDGAGLTFGEAVCEGGGLFGVRKILEGGGGNLLRSQFSSHLLLEADLQDMVMSVLMEKAGQGGLGELNLLSKMISAVHGVNEVL